MNINIENQPRQRAKDEPLIFRFKTSPDELRIKETPAGVMFEFNDGFKNLNEPGLPALPSKIVHVALPAGAADIKVYAESEQRTKLFDKPVLIMPVPDYQVGMKNDDLQRVKKNRLEVINHTIRNIQFEPRAIPDARMLLAPHPEKYNRFFENPRPLAELINTSVAANNVIADIVINPITVSSDFIPELNEDIVVRVAYSLVRTEEVNRRSTVRSLSPNKVIQQNLHDQLRKKVINPYDIIELTDIPWFVFGQYDYLVITDNWTWDSETITRKQEIGDMVSKFQTLVEWKRQKGLKARVVTITDIVNGKYGDHKTGAVDLQEVIRNFLKFAHSTWGVTWCLLGGDVEIVPVRQAAGECRGDVNEQTQHNPPDDNEGFWTGSFMKIKAVSLGEWFSVNDSYLKLTNKNTGRLIPKKSPRNQLFVESLHINGFSKLLPDLFFETSVQFQQRLGWYFCTDNTYTTYSATPTQYIRVDGNAAIIHAPLRFHYTWNTIPTDFYYASLFGPNYGLPGKHDWDLNNNGIYGQHEWTNNYDPINWHSDVIVGRAPVSSVNDAEVFVKKVVEYEKFRTEAGYPLDRNYLDKTLLVSTNWGGRVGFYSTNVNPPSPGQFYTDTPHSRAILQTNSDFTKDWNWELISWINDTDVWLIPYNINATQGVRGWYYAFGPSDLRPAIMEINLPWGIHFEFPLITNTIVVYGNASDIAPQYFIFDRTEADGSMMDQEALRIQLDNEIPLLKRFSRLYEDIDSLPVANRNAAPIARFTDAALNTALNEGHHFLSLSGHGSMSGCCGLDSWKAGSTTNGNKYFIAFADSCLTNDFGYTDSMSESLIKNPNGGAVAYVGHTRFSWIGLGDDFQRAFFHEMVNTRHIGLLHNSRLNVLLSGSRGPHDHYNKWSVLALNLLGDPEMEVYRVKPPFIIPDIYFEFENLFIRVIEDDLVHKPVTDFEVRVITGEQTYLLKPDDGGMVPFRQEWLNQDNLMLSVAVKDGSPVTITGNELRSKLELSKRTQTQVQEEKEDILTLPVQEEKKVELATARELEVVRTEESSAKSDKTKIADSQLQD